MSSTTQNNHPTSTSTSTIFTTKAIECERKSSSCLRAANALLRSTISALQNDTISPTDLAHAEAHSSRLTVTGDVLHALARVLLEDDCVALKSRLVRVDVSGSVTWTIEQAEEFVKTMKAIRDETGEEVPELRIDGAGLLDDGTGAQVDGGEEPTADRFSQPLVFRGARPGHDGA
ncbi:hypothetical protein TI39_contig306g00010 [Zymoseptoria brevis]|uniref:Uncharacterized protein n=1 Tax=Zymoseptoria brevis TaxID=1047168 RepID=A0A0F4GUE1_9PEZI|nr:hypothetical protein TI39_contig306g00010 [Zymoseptoria brevis]